MTPIARNKPSVMPTWLYFWAVSAEDQEWTYMTFSNKTQPYSSDMART